MTLLSEVNVTFVFAAAFFISFLTGVFHVAKITEKMGDDIK